MSPEVLSKDFLISIGEAKIEKKGSSITVVGYSKSLDLILDAADRLKESGIDVEVFFAYANSNVKANCET